MYRVIVSNPAQKRLKEIYDYLIERNSDTTAKKSADLCLKPLRALKKCLSVALFSPEQKA